MDMDDNVLQHMMNTQTQMIQQLTNIAQDIQMSSAQASPVSQPMPQMNQGAMSVTDPTMYGTYAAPHGGGGRQNQGFVENISSTMPDMGGMIDGFNGFDRTRTSREDQSQIAFDRSRGFQESLVEGTIGAVGTGGAAASMFVPGLLPSLAVGGAVGLGVGGAASMVSGGATTALDYQEILQQSGDRAFNAFQSTDDFGGIGMGIDDRQELSRFLRELSPEKFLSDDEMGDILQGSLDNNLMRTVQDVHQFKDRFDDIVDTVKEITLTMNQTIEEATAFMGEMERMGVQNRDMSQYASQMRVTSSILGMDPTQGGQMIMNATQGITQGTTMDASAVGESVSQTMVQAQQYEDYARENDERMFNYMSNQGGAANVAANFEQDSRRFVDSQGGRDSLIGAYATMFQLNEGTGRFELDRDEMDRLFSGELSASEMHQRSQTYSQTLTADERRRLESSSAEIFNRDASSADLSRFMKASTDMMIESSGYDIDFETMLVERGIANSYEQAELYSQLYDMADDDQLTSHYQAQVTKDRQDAAAMASNPGWWARTKFRFQSNFGVPVGNIGQNIGDFVGQRVNDFNVALSDAEYGDMVGGEPLPSFDAKGVESVFGVLGDVQENLNDRKEYMYEQGYMDKDLDRSNQTMSDFDIDEVMANVDESRDLSRGQYDRYRRSLQDGTMGENDLLDVLETDMGGWFEDGKIFGDWESRNRQGMLRNEADGAYDGWFGKVRYHTRRGTTGLLSGMDTVFEGAVSTVDYLTGGPTADYITGLFSSGDEVEGALGVLEGQGELLDEQRRDLSREMRDYFENSGLRGQMSPDELRELEDAIARGDVSAMPDSESRALAESYKELNKETESYQEDFGAYEDMTRYTQGVANLGSQLSGYMSTLGIYTDGELDDLLSDFQDRSEDGLEDLADGKMNVEDKVAFTMQSFEDLNQIMEGAAPVDRREIAEQLARDHQNIRYEDMTLEGSEEIDPEKLSTTMLELFRSQNADSPFAGEEDGSDFFEADSSQEMNQKAIDAAHSHEQVMAEYIETLQNERGMIEDALAGQTVREPRNSSSVTTRP